MLLLTVRLVMLQGDTALLMAMRHNPCHYLAIVKLLFSARPGLNSSKQVTSLLPASLYHTVFPMVLSVHRQAYCPLFIRHFVCDEDFVAGFASFDARLPHE